MKKFNDYFGTDFDERELEMAKMFAHEIAEEQGYDEYETDEHWYAAIEKVLEMRDDLEAEAEQAKHSIREARRTLVACTQACMDMEDDGNHMSRQFLQDIAGAAEEMFHLVNEDGELEDWVEFKISRARTDLHDVLSYLRYWLKDSHPNWMETSEPSMQDQQMMLLAEQKPHLAKIAAKYKGKEVTLNKPTKGDRKKYKVYVKNDKGNIVKVEFGDPNMSIKRDDPKRRKNFRARHNCKDPGPKWKARYWSCKMWSSKPVSKILKDK